MLWRSGTTTYFLYQTTRLRSPAEQAEITKAEITLIRSVRIIAWFILWHVSYYAWWVLYYDFCVSHYPFWVLYYTF